MEVEEEIRHRAEEISEVCNIMLENGWLAANDGNVSAKNSDGTIVITPAGIRKSSISPDMMILLSPEGDVIGAPIGFRPSSELKMHLCCYAERPDIHAVIHAHPPVSTGFAAANIALDGYSTIEAVLALGGVPVTPYATPSTEEIPEAIAPYLKEHDALLLQNHGALTVGVNLETALNNMETMEHYAKISLVARLLGGEKEIPRDGLDKLFALREKGYKMSGRHPGYKKFPLGFR